MRYDADGRCNNAFEILSDPKMLIMAYNSIKSNPGNMTNGIDQETPDGLDMKWFSETSRLLVREAWNPKPARRVYIPKTNGKMRPLGISSPRDKIVQQSMKLTLEAILEPLFSNLSHGFRPKRGCHTALREIRNWKGVTWFLEGDIKSFFDNIDHNILESLIKKHFSEARIIHLYWKFVKAGYVEWDKDKIKYVSTGMGVPQGGIISPLLSNLILHELDQYMENKIKKWEEENMNNSPHLTNPLYHRLTMRINRLSNKISKIDKDDGYRQKKLKWVKLIKARRKLKSLIPNPEFRKIRYVRYADDWLVGVWGTKPDVVNIKTEVTELLQRLKLELSVEKTLITNARTNRAKFLGTVIKRMASSTSTYFQGVGKHRRRIATGNIWMTAPILELVSKLEDREFLKCTRGRWSPKSISKFTLIPITDIILRYNSIVNGIANYYSFVDNRRRLNKIVWILKESLRKTISRKLKINKKIFIRKFSKHIVIKKFIKRRKETKTIRFECPDLTRRPMLFLGKASFQDPLLALDKKVSTINSLGMACSNCGSTNTIEMHHIRHIKTINVKLNTFEKMMAKINRKQVPLCKKCHNKVHRGEYQGLKLSNYNMVWRTAAH